MTKWTAEKIEEQFKRTARIRIRDKKKGDKRYSGDATYWEGGFCNWGANHNLYEDCNTLAKFFNKTNELKEANKKIVNSAGSQEEFDSKIKELAKQTDEIITELNKVKGNIGSNSSIGGICIIWNEYLGFVGKKVDNLRKEVERVKRDILQSVYDNAKELRSLQIEEKKLKKEVEELTENIENESDESKKTSLSFY